MSRFSENIQLAPPSPVTPKNSATSSPNNSLELPTKIERSPTEPSFSHDNQFGSGPKRSSSGLLAIFKWFKKSPKDSFDSSSSESSNSDNDVTPTISRNGSIASIYSTATVASFTFVPPAVYHPRKGNIAEKLIAPGPETNTHKNRMKQLEKHRERDKNLTLRKKYKLFSCETSVKISDKKKKDKDYSELSLPSIKVCQDSKSDGKNVGIKSKHRRTVSDSSKDKKAGAYCHVKGKRKAPAPPNTVSVNNNLNSPNNTLTRRMKRQAPAPPNANAETPSIPDVVCNDSLKLESGVLKPVKEAVAANKPTVKSPISPKPWYKRTLSNRESVISHTKKDIEPPREISKFSSVLSRFSLTSSEERKKDEHRKSGLSMLANISELDREAAMIVQQEQSKEQARINEQNEAYYSPSNSQNDVPSFLAQGGGKSTAKRGSARELISKFNALTNAASRITVNSRRFSFQSSESAVTPPMKRSIFKLEEFNETQEEEPKLLNTPPNILKYFEPKEASKPEEIKVPNIVKEVVPKPIENIEPVKKDGWTCTRCTLENNRMDVKCVVCGMWKPFSKSAIEKYLPANTPKIEKVVKEDTKVDARTFAENVFKVVEMQNEIPKLPQQPVEDPPKQPEEKEVPKPLEENVVITSVTVVESELSIEQLRKARLARFSQNLDDLEPIDKEKVEVKETKLSEEQIKLRQMLKELRDGLPKNDSRKSTLEKPEPDVSKGAIPKVKQPKPPVIVDEILKTSSSEKTEKLDKLEILPVATKIEDKSVKVLDRPDKLEIPPVEKKVEENNEKVITAIFVTKETTYENIKIKNDNIEKPVKVSASSQTQSKITIKPPSGIDESRKPISRVNSFSKGSYELIRAKDFVGISSNVTTPDSPLYANLPSTIQALETPQSSSSEEDLILSSEAIKDFRATLKQDKHNANTLAINRLLRRLESAIASGQHVQAAKLAKDLARLKVNCSVTRQKRMDVPNVKYITADMYVEDQVTHQGPIPLRINPNMTIADLKQKVAQEFEIPSHVQRWILDRQLASDDDITLDELNINFDGCPMFLYLVAPDNENDETLKRARNIPNLTKQLVELQDSDSDITEEDEEVPSTSQIKKSPSPIPPNMWRCEVCTLINPNDRPGCEACSTEQPKQKNYLKLVDLDNTDLVLNSEPFECCICFVECPSGDGVILRECLHTFCKLCLAQTIQYTEEAEIKCPYRDSVYSCDLVLQEREIKALVTSEVYEQHLALSVAQAENKIDNAFHCKTPDCRGWCIFEDNVNEFKCPVCRAMNCLTCRVIHEGLDCKQYQEQLNQNSESNLEARRTRDFLDEMVARGEAMVCPTCQVVLMKKWGCDWLRCSMCKTEICWVTRGPRWGPSGKGDVSGGCKCGVNGIKCHPKCTYCH